jgi:uncharacterized membrane protein
MKERVLIYSVVILVVINIAALGTIIYQRVAHPSWDGPRRGGEMGQPPDGQAGFRLGPEQRDKMRESRKMVDSLLAPVHSELRQKRQALFTEMGSSQPDTTKIDQLVTEIGALQVMVQKTMIHHFLEDSKGFAPAQRSAFLKMIELRARWQERPMMGEGRGFGHEDRDSQGNDEERRSH